MDDLPEDLAERVAALMALEPKAAVFARKPDAAAAQLALGRQLKRYRDEDPDLLLAAIERAIEAAEKHAASAKTGTKVSGRVSEPIESATSWIGKNVGTQLAAACEAKAREIVTLEALAASIPLQSKAIADGARDKGKRGRGAVNGHADAAPADDRDRELAALCARSTIGLGGGSVLTNADVVAVADRHTGLMPNQVRKALLDAEAALAAKAGGKFTKLSPTAVLKAAEPNLRHAAAGGSPRELVPGPYVTFGNRELVNDVIAIPRTALDAALTAAKQAHVEKWGFEPSIDGEVPLSDAWRVFNGLEGDPKAHGLDPEKYGAAFLAQAVAAFTEKLTAALTVDWDRRAPALKAKRESEAEAKDAVDRGYVMRALYGGVTADLEAYRLASGAGTLNPIGTPPTADLPKPTAAAGSPTRGGFANRSNHDPFKF